MTQRRNCCRPTSLFTASSFAMLLAIAATGSAQNPRGAVRGVVEDTSGGRIRFAAVHIEAAGASVPRDAASDEHGEFRFDDLLPGAYRLVVKAPGFAEAASDVTVLVSHVQALVVTLRPEAIQQTVNVTGQPSSITSQPLDTASAVHQAIVTARDLETLPLAARSFANIAYLAPGTEPVEPSNPTKARITAVSSGGSSGLNMELSVDGGDNSDDYIGGFLQNFSPDAIQEFAVRTALADADTGRTVGSSVVITTRSGSNDWHGHLAFYERAAALNARFPVDNPAPNPKQPFSRQNYSGTFGGPIVKGKAWFFSSLEYVHEDASIAYSPATAAQFDALSQLASQGLLSVNGTALNAVTVPSSVPVPFRDHLGLFRVDWTQSARSRWFVRGAFDSYTTQNAFVQQGALPSTGATSHNRYLSLVVSNDFVFSPTWVASLVVNASGLHLSEARNVNLGFALAFPFTATSSSVSGLETLGDNQFITPITAFPVDRRQEKSQVRYDVTHTQGSHSLRFGVNVIHEPVLNGALASSAETLISLGMNPTDYLANPQQFSADLICNQGQVPSLPLATPGTTCAATPASDGSFAQDVQRLGLYAEDSWRVTPRLTVNAGVRYDTTFGLFTASGRSQLDNPAYLTLQALQIPLINGVPHDYRFAIAPRVGVAYSLGASGTTVLRGGAGLYYNDLAQNGWVGAFQAVNAAPLPCVTAIGPSPDPGACPGPRRRARWVPSPDRRRSSTRTTRPRMPCTSLLASSARSARTGSSVRTGPTRTACMAIGATSTRRVIRCSPRSCRKLSTRSALLSRTSACSGRTTVRAMTRWPFTSRPTWPAAST